MSDFQSQINKLVDSFVAQVTAVARQAAMDTLTAALGAAGGKRAIAGGGAPRASTARRLKGAKRPQSEIEKTKDRVNDFIHKHPGLRIEQINRELGTSTRDLSLPLRKLISDGAVRTEGEKRSTQYFPGDGKSRGESGGASGPRRRKKK
jgi:hypothetical protein